jgi:hypothetical protein
MKFDDYMKMEMMCWMEAFTRAQKETNNLVDMKNTAEIATNAFAEKYVEEIEDEIDPEAHWMEATCEELKEEYKASKENFISSIYNEIHSSIKENDDYVVVKITNPEIVQLFIDKGFTVEASSLGILPKLNVYKISGWAV